MKKWICCLLAAALVFSLAACQAPAEPDPTNPPGGNGSSKPTSKEPPTLKVLDSTCMGLEATRGTYSWTYDNGDGTKSGVCADSSHPLEWQEYLVPMITADDTVELHFDVQPQSFTVRCWSDTYWGQMDAKEESVSVDGNTLELKEGGYIYEVTATWTGENLAAEGTAHYGFYVIRDDHSHTPAEDPQTVEDPYSGYCGNTMTTITLDGKEYTFEGSDSVYLTDLLLNLDYDPMRVCRCTPEFEVTTEFGGPYGVNLSQGYARCEVGQADLTVEQVELIQEILDNQT